MCYHQVSVPPGFAILLTIIITIITVVHFKVPSCFMSPVCVAFKGTSRCSRVNGEFIPSKLHLDDIQFMVKSPKTQYTLFLWVLVYQFLIKKF